MLKELLDDDEETLDVLEEALMLEEELRGKAVRGWRRDSAAVERLRQLTKRVTELREANYYGAERSAAMRENVRVMCANHYVEYLGWTSVRMDATEYAQ